MLYNASIDANTLFLIYIANKSSSSGGSGDLNLLNWFVCDFLYALQRAAVQNPLLFEFETDIPSAVY